MKKLALILPLLLLSAFVFATPPDEPNQGLKSGVSWHTVTLVEFENGSLGEAKEIIKKFESASVSAGLPVTSLRWFESGKYDLVVIWELEEEPSQPDWNWCPLADVWWTSFVAQEGSEEAALTIQNKYKSLVTSTVTNIARKSK